MYFKAFLLAVLFLFNAGWGHGQTVMDIREAYPGWNTYTNEHLVVYYATNSVLTRRKTIQLWTKVRVGVYNDIVKYLALTNTPTIKIFVYDNNYVAQEYIHQRAGFSIHKLGIIHMCVNNTKGHEICHILSKTIRPDGQTPFSRVLSEGIATFLDYNERGWDYLEFGKQLLENDNLPDFYTLNKMWANPNTNEQSYRPSAAFVAFLLNRYGLEKFKRLWVLNGRDYDKNFLDAYGKDCKQLDAEWREYLRNYHRKTTNYSGL